MEIRQIKPGVLSNETLMDTPGYQLDKIIKSGKAAVVIECAEDIPCNPCETVCPFGAITVGKPITNLPVVDLAKCTGCGLCVAACPGLAIFLINPNVDEQHASVMMPYEYIPVPAAGDDVQATNRLGEAVCEGRIMKVSNIKKNDLTVVLTVKIPKAFIGEVRGIKRPAKR